MITDWSVETAEPSHVAVVTCTERETRYAGKQMGLLCHGCATGVLQTLPNAATQFLLAHRFHPTLLSKRLDEAISVFIRRLLFPFFEYYRSSNSQSDSSPPAQTRFLPPWGTSFHCVLPFTPILTPTAVMADAHLVSKHGAPQMRSCDPDRATHAITSPRLVQILGDHGKRDI